MNKYQTGVKIFEVALKLCTIFVCGVFPSKLNGLHLFVFIDRQYHFRLVNVMRSVRIKKIKEVAISGCPPRFWLSVKAVTI